MEKILHFLQELRKNNNREWFNANKTTYLEAKEQFESIVNQLIVGIRKFDTDIGPLTAKDCVFRIYRDVRFSKNKDPYKTNMGGFIAKGGRKGGNAGYYLHLDPEYSFLAGGSHMPIPERLKKIRMEIMYNIGEFKAIIENPAFKRTFGKIEGEKLKRPPKDFPPDFSDIDLLKYKSYTVMHPISTSKIGEPEFLKYSLDVFRELLPFNKFLNRAFD